FRYAKKGKLTSGARQLFLTIRRRSRQHVRIPKKTSQRAIGSRGSMKIGRQSEHASSISSSNAETIIVRGRDLCAELIGRTSFTDYVWLLLTGEVPQPAQSRMLDATLVAIAEHRLVPSVQAGRITSA